MLPAWAAGKAQEQHRAFQATCCPCCSYAAGGGISGHEGIFVSACTEGLHHTSARPGAETP